jgi:L-lysine exporter family protein LysE/ArgO
MNYLLTGFSLGLAYVMPIGVQNTFVMQSAVSQGIPRSYLTASIVSVVDVSLGIACLLGMGRLFTYTPLKLLFLGLGSLFLLYLGTQLIRTPVKEVQASERKIARLPDIFQKSIIFTWLNPQAIIDGTLLFGSYRASLSANALFPFTLGMLLASPSWFFFITTLLGYSVKELSARKIKIINILCGMMLYAFAIRLGFCFYTGLFSP